MPPTVNSAVPSGTAASPSSMSFISIIQTLRTQLELPAELSCEEVLRAAYPMLAGQQYPTQPAAVGLWPAAQWLANKFFGPYCGNSEEQCTPTPRLPPSFPIAPTQPALTQLRRSPSSISLDAASSSPFPVAVTHDTSPLDSACSPTGSDTDSVRDLDLSANVPVCADSAAYTDHAVSPGGCVFTRSACFKDRPLRDHATLLHGQHFLSRRECTGYVQRINLEHGCRGIRTVDPGRHYFYNIVCQCSRCPYFLRIHLTHSVNTATTDYWVVDCSNSITKHSIDHCISVGKASVTFLVQNDYFRHLVHSSRGDIGGCTLHFRPTVKQLRADLTITLGIESSINNVARARTVIERGPWVKYKESFHVLSRWLDRYCQLNPGSASSLQPAVNTCMGNSFRGVFLANGTILRLVEACGLRILGQDFCHITHS